MQNNNKKNENQGYYDRACLSILHQEKAKIIWFLSLENEFTGQNLIKARLMHTN